MQPNPALRDQLLQAAFDDIGAKLINRPLTNTEKAMIAFAVGHIMGRIEAMGIEASRSTKQ